MTSRSQTQRVLLIAFITSLGCCGALGIYVVLLGSMGSFEGKILGTTAAVAGASILGLVSAVPWSRRRWHPIGPVSACAIAAALISFLIMIWWDLSWRDPRRELVDKVTLSLAVLAVAFPHMGLIALAQLHRSHEWFRKATVGIVVCLAFALEWTTWADGSGRFLPRLIGALVIADVCASTALPILHRMSKIRMRDEVRTVELNLSLTCPRCSLAQSLSVGRSACAQCGLRFQIEIEEEQCAACGYPLYRLESSVCPECGTPIAQANAPAD